MQVREIMSMKPQFLPPTASLMEAALKMQELDCGFIPVGENDRLIGAVTDRDLVMRALTKNRDLKQMTLKDVLSKDIEFCFEDDALDQAIQRMEDKQIQRLVVLNKNKRMSGILTLGDIARLSSDNKLCAEAMQKIKKDFH